MQAGILNGLFGQQTVPSTFCSTANCRWTDVSTLGICSSCENITSTTNTTCHESHGTVAAYTPSPILRSCQYSLPSGKRLTAAVPDVSHLSVDQLGLEQDLQLTLVGTVSGSVFESDLVLSCATIQPSTTLASGIQPHANMPSSIVVELHHIPSFRSPNFQ